MPKSLILTLFAGLLLTACGPSAQEYAVFNNQLVEVLDSARANMNRVTMTLNIGYRMDGDSILNEPALAKAFRRFQRQYADYTKQARNLDAPDDLTAVVQQKAVALLESYEQLVDAYEDIRTLQLRVAKGQLSQNEMQTEAKAIEKARLMALLAVQEEFREAHNTFLERGGLQ
ncbi:MAG: hypothetical protein ACOCZ8_02795, partial [Bacteroidota bacterium]